jgi:hypothetical protein
MEENLVSTIGWCCLKRTFQEMRMKTLKIAEGFSVWSTGSLEHGDEREMRATGLERGKNDIDVMGMRWSFTRMCPQIRHPGTQRIHNRSFATGTESCTTTRRRRHNHFTVFCAPTLIKPIYNMPPPRSRPQPDDSRSEASSTKEKLNTNTANTQNGKGRRVGSTAVAGSSLRDVVTAGQNTTGAVGSGATSSDTNAGVRIATEWTKNSS